VQMPLWSGRRLVSLWDMINFHVIQFWYLATELMCMEMDLPPAMTKEWSVHVGAVIKFAEQHCKAVELGDAAMLPLYSIKSELGRFDLTNSYITDIRPQIKALREGIHVELGKRKFAYIPSSVDKYFEQEQLFGEAVFKKFEDARDDVKEAGNCLAAGLPTACVFHLTRVAEIGLRYIAAKVGVKLTDKGKPQPVEYATWDKVIHGIQSKIAQAKTLHQGPRKAAKLSFFSEAAEQCSYIKEIRNEVSHTRKRYNENEALGAMQRIKSFMELLTGEPQ
jgi:hypothetical protein